MPQMRFLHYQQSGFLAPHTDLARRDWRTGDRTTHTFILYLSDRTVHEAHVGFGGETVLLQSLKGDELVKVSNSKIEGFKSRPIANVWRYVFRLEAIAI